MEEKDREIRIGEHRLYLAEDNTLYITVVGEQDEQTALAIKESLPIFAGMVEGKFDVLVDNNKAGKASSEARKIFRELTELENIGKIAIFGAHPVARVLASFAIGVSGKKDIRFFKSKEEALVWLKE